MTKGLGRHALSYIRGVMDAAARRVSASAGTYWPCRTNAGDLHESNMVAQVATQLGHDEWRTWCEVRYPPDAGGGRLDLLAHHADRQEVWIVEAKHLYAWPTHGRPTVEGLVADIGRLARWHPVVPREDAPWFWEAKRIGMVIVLTWDDIGPWWSRPSGRPASATIPNASWKTMRLKLTAPNARRGVLELPGASDPESTGYMTWLAWPLT
jgi:hypothetical protein